MTHINPSEITSIIRSELIEQSEIPSSFVRNVTTKFGSMFDKQLSDNIFNTITDEDCLLFFALQKTSSQEDVSFDESNTEILYASIYEVHCSIYGNSSTEVAIKTTSRLRTEIIRSKLYQKGIYLQNITNISSLQEIKGNTIWQRADFTIQIGCEHLIEIITEDNIYEELNIVSTNEELNIK